jgi:hypothetical protein
MTHIVYNLGEGARLVSSCNVGIKPETLVKESKPYPKINSRDGEDKECSSRQFFRLKIVMLIYSLIFRLCDFLTVKSLVALI